MPPPPPAACLGPPGRSLSHGAVFLKIQGKDLPHAAPDHDGHVLNPGIGMAGDVAAKTLGVQAAVGMKGRDHEAVNALDTLPQGVHVGVARGPRPGRFRPIGDFTAIAPAIRPIFLRSALRLEPPIVRSPSSFPSTSVIDGMLPPQGRGAQCRPGTAIGVIPGMECEGFRNPASQVVVG